MKTTQKTLLIIALLIAHISFGQSSDKDIARAKAGQAIQLMDAGKTDEGIALMKEAQKLDPDNFDIAYEIAYGYFQKADYKAAIKLLEKNKKHKDVTDQLYQLLGNGYDIIGKREKALETYQAGLQLFPNSGHILLEIGNVFWSEKEYNKAINFYEKGIEVEPDFSSNYYRASILYCSSSEEVWGLIYGEIFMNLERNSKRTAEVSAMLYKVYANEIRITSDSTMSISLCNQMNINLSDVSDVANMKMPFCMFYEPAMLMGALGLDKVDLDGLDKIRTRFVDAWFEGENSKNYPNLLFDYQLKVQKAGHLEAYNHWILMKGDEAAFGDWVKVNQDKWDAFIAWFSDKDNYLEPIPGNQFYSAQYTEPLVHGQNLAYLDNIKLRKPADFATHEKDVIKAVDYLLATPADDADGNRKFCSRFIVIYAEKSPDYTMVLNAKILKITDKNAALLPIYMGLYLKSAISDKAKSDAERQQYIFTEIYRYVKAGNDIQLTESVNALIAAGDAGTIPAWIEALQNSK
jgi:tetratricopeptide (TPR) repeat protein